MSGEYHVAGGVLVVGQMATTEMGCQNNLMDQDQWLANFLITSTFPALAEAGLSFAYGLYAAFALISLLFVVFAVRETKGMELEDMPG